MVRKPVVAWGVGEDVCVQHFTLHLPPHPLPMRRHTRVRGWQRVNIEPHFGMKVEGVGLCATVTAKPAMPSWMCVRVRVCENFDS